MAPHLMRAQGAYKADKHATHTHAHTHTHTPSKSTSIVVMGLMETEERKREISGQKRRICASCDAYATALHDFTIALHYVS